LASIVLQKGSTCLVTSDNPRALEAFEQKLPPKLAKFCINMSTMEECGVGTLSQTLERREADLAELLEGKDGFEKDIKVSLTTGIQYVYVLNEAVISHPLSVAALLRPRGCGKKLLA
jgi:hypothetical protein